MSSSCFKLVFAVCLLLLQLLDLCRGAKVGVAYGRDANNLPSPDRVAQLVRNKNIQYIKIYDTDSQVLTAFANTGIELTVGVHNSDLSAFQSQSSVDSWFSNNIRPFYPATKITYITVGNEVDQPGNEAFAQLVITALRNVVSALKSNNLQDQIKVSTPLSFGVISKSTPFPPSAGAFRSDLEFLLRPFLQFLDENQSPFMVNLYPFFAAQASSLDYALFKPTTPVKDPNTGLSYNNLFDAQLDTVYYAISNRNFKTSSDAQVDDVRSSLAGSRTPKIIVTETGWKTKGPHRGGALHVMDDSGEEYASVENAETYNSNLIRRVTGGSGTPGTPDAEIDAYIFSLFDENLKGPDEGSWGVYNPDMTSKYNLDFPGKGNVPSPTPTPSGRTWCVASSRASNAAIQTALDFACGQGKADCSAVQPGRQCFDPNNLVSHASFAFNNYYQKNGLTDEACKFGGAGAKVYADPSYGGCSYQSDGPRKGAVSVGRTWCVASSRASNPALQTALDFACGQGKADCSAIQPGQQCFEPNNLASHASFAFNNYYQKNGANDEACKFGGAGAKVYADPTSNGNCIKPCKYNF